MAIQTIKVTETDLPDVGITYQGDALLVPLIELMRTGKLILKTYEGEEIPVNVVITGFNCIEQRRATNEVLLSQEIYGLENPLDPLMFSEFWQTEQFKANRGLSNFSRAEDVPFEPPGYDLVFDDSELNSP